MKRDLVVPSGTGTKPGFSVELGEKAILIYCGALGDESAMFGIANDEGGVSISAYPVTTNEILARLETYVTQEAGNIIETLRGDITLVELDHPGGAVIRTICTQLQQVWAFSYTVQSPYPIIIDLSSGTGFMGEHFPGVGFLTPGDYRLTIYWWGYTAGGYKWSHNALQTIEFTSEPNSWIAWIPPFERHWNRTDPEW